MAEREKIDLQKPIIIASVWGLLTATNLWGDSLHHWHNLSALRMFSDFLLLPVSLILSIVAIFRGQSANKGIS